MQKKTRVWAEAIASVMVKAIPGFPKINQRKRISAAIRGEQPKGKKKKNAAFPPRTKGERGMKKEGERGKNRWP